MNKASISVSNLIASLHKPLVAYYQNERLANHYAWWLVSAITGKSKDSLLSLGQISLSLIDYETLQQWLVEMTIDHKPLAYILGTMPFADLEVMVEPPILIPRPETEEWVVTLIDQLHALKDQSLTILDMGTGSGCIALALAHALPESRIVAVDFSDRALNLAQRNAQRYSLDNISFIYSDLFLNLPDDSMFDLIVSNPPYVSANEWALLEPTVTHWEDHAALVADEEGLGHLKKIIAYAPAYIKPNSALKALHIPNLLVEIGYEQGRSVQQYMHEHGAHHSEITQDLAGRDRVVKGYFYEDDIQETDS